jgi:hypothetical protein
MPACLCPRCLGDREEQQASCKEKQSADGVRREQESPKRDSKAPTAYYVGEYAISSRGLDYSSPDVQGYVKRVAQRYRVRRVLRARSQLSRQREKLR